MNSSETATFTPEFNFVCVATVQRHNAKGLLYRHRWATGFDELVVRDEAHAERQAKALGASVQHKTGNRFTP
jgi:hypothetical protein